MIGMSFLSFLILFVISIIVSLILHFGTKTLARKGFESFLSKIIIGWIGGWLGSPVLGNWFKGFRIADVYIIPAILGSFALIIFLVDLVKTFKTTTE